MSSALAWAMFLGRIYNNVPVLSEQMSVTAPKASGELRFLTMAFPGIILFVSAAMAVVMIMTRDVGIIERPVATAYITASWQRLNWLAPRTMMVQVEAMRNNRTASLDSFDRSN